MNCKTCFIQIENAKRGVFCSTLCRFMSFVKKTNSCWLWTGGRTSDGYGKFKFDYKNMRANRFSFALFKGDLEPSYLVCHSCDNILCVNPDHLWLGKPKDNSSDMTKKKRQFSKINEKDVVQIRELYKTGYYYQKEIGSMFNISACHVSKIVSHGKWKHVGEEVDGTI